MSYAAATAQNLPPPHEQPKPDPALLTTPADVSNPSDIQQDENAKVHIVPTDYQPANPEPEGAPSYLVDEDFGSNGHPGSDDSKRKKARKQTSRAYREAQAEGIYLWESLKHYLVRPGVAGGLVGLVNIGLSGLVGLKLYNEPHLRRDTRFISTITGGALALLITEGFAAEKYAQTERGRLEAARAKEEGTLIYKHTREVVLRPGVLGGLVGLLNTGILSTIGYYSYLNWNRPWDRRVVSSVTVGLLALFSGEGLLAKTYRK